MSVSETQTQPTSKLTRLAILSWGLGHHMAYLGIYKARWAMMVGVIRHDWRIPANNMKYFYIYQIFYKILVATTKMSFIFLYIDLFPLSWFKVVCHVTNASIVMAMIAFTLGTVFQCTPIPYYWNRSIKGGHCIRSGPFWYGHAAWNTVSKHFAQMVEKREF